MIYVVRDNNNTDGFFSRISKDSGSNVTVKRETMRENDPLSKKVFSRTLKGNHISGTFKTARTEWDERKFTYVTSLTDAELSELVMQIGYLNPTTNEPVTKVNQKNKFDPFLAHFKVKVDVGTTIDDSNPMGKLQKAILWGKRWLMIEGEDSHLSEREKKNFVNFVLAPMGSDTKEEYKEMEGAVSLIAKATTLSYEKKKLIVGMLITTPIKGDPDDETLLNIIVKKLMSHGNEKVNLKFGNETNYQFIERLIGMEMSEIETNYRIAQGFNFRLIQYVSDLQRWEYNEINVGRSEKEANEYFRKPENSDMLNKLAIDVEKRKKGIAISEEAPKKKGK